jgi:hypothetical protein
VSKILWRILIVITTGVIFSWTAYSIYRITTTSAPDFSILWKTAVDTLAHKNPYLDNSLIYGLLLPPITLIFYIPLAILDYKVAQAIFLIASFLATVACVYISLKITFKKISLYTILIATSLTFLSFPTKFTLGMGQVNSISFLFLILSYYFYQKGKSSLSGALLGVSIVSKPIFGFFLIFFVIKRCWKLVSCAIFTLLFAFGVSVWINGLNTYSYWFRNILPTLLSAQGQGKEVYYNQGLTGFISRLNINFEVRKYLTTVILIPIALYPIYLSFRKKNEDLQFSFFMVTLLLIDTLSWQHHFVWLILPFILLTKVALKVKGAWFWIFLGAAYVAVGWNFKNPIIFSEFPKSLILSNTFFGTLIVYFLTLYSLNRKGPYTSTTTGKIMGRRPVFW